MSNRHNLQAAPILLLLLLLLFFTAGTHCIKVSSWFSYADSMEALVSADATLNLTSLSPSQRTLAVAVGLCHRQQPQQTSPPTSSESEPENFCAWVAVNDSDGGRPVAVSCFNEWHRQCNRRSLTSGSKYRQAECELCSPCAYGKWDACPKCRRVCYCTCAHRRYASIENSGASMDGRNGLFQCHEFCDGRAQCDNQNDERTDTCDYYKLEGSPAPDGTVGSDRIYNIFFFFGALAVCAGILYWKYSSYQAFMRRMSAAAPTAQPLVPLNLPPDSYPRQDLPQSPPPQGGGDYPPPPSYESVAIGERNRLG